MNVVNNTENIIFFAMLKYLDFKKFRFRGSFYADTNVLVWTEGLTITKKLRFQIYPA